MLPRALNRKMGQGRTREIVLRLWRIVEALHGKTRGMRVRDLTEEIGVSRSTLYRDLALLEQSGVPLFRDTVTGEVRYRLERMALPTLRPTATQLLALLIARDMLSPLEGSDILRELDALLEPRRASSIGTKKIGHLGRAGHPHPSIVEAVDRAMKLRKSLRLRYQAASTGETSWREVDPLRLRIVDNHLYLIGWDLSRANWRTFKMTRVISVDVLDRAADVRPDPDDARLFENAVHIWCGDVQEVAVRIDEEVAWLLAEYPLHPQQQVEHSVDGVVVRAKVAGLTETMRWVLRWGSSAEALEPPALRMALVEQHSAALASYQTTSEKLRPPVSAKVRRRHEKMQSSTG